MRGRIKRSTEDLRDFVNDLRDCLGLDPIRSHHDKPKAKRETDEVRFGALTYPDPDDRHQRERGFT